MSGIRGLTWGKSNSSELTKLRLELDQYKRMHKREMLENQVWRTAVCMAAMSGKISTEAQLAIYDIVSANTEVIYDKLV